MEFLIQSASNNDLYEQIPNSSVNNIDHIERTLPTPLFIYYLLSLINRLVIHHINPD